MVICANAEFNASSNQKDKIAGSVMFLYVSLKMGQPYISWVDGENTGRFKYADTNALAVSWSQVQRSAAKHFFKDGRKCSNPDTYCYQHFARNLR